MACTFRVATAESRFGLPEIKLGLIPGYGGTQRLPRLVGSGPAIELIASGRAINAEEAERIGLVHRVFEGTDAVDAGVAFLSSLAPGFPASVGQALTAVNRSVELSLEDGLRLEAELFAAATQTQDAIEGISAFLEKRKPEFVGR